MKKLLYISSFALLALTACDYNAQFDGLEDSATPSDVKTLEYTMTDADYAAVASNRVNQGLAGDDNKAALAAVKSQKAFSLAIPAPQYAPAFLAAKWPTADEASAVKLTYNTYGALSKEVIDASAAGIYAVSAANYDTVWGEGAGVKFFTPAKPASKYVPKFLSETYDDATSGSTMLVNYNVAQEEPSGVVVAINENFNRFAGTEYDVKIDGWYNVTTVGTYLWSGRIYNENGYIQAGAFKHTGALESYMIAKPFMVVEGMKFSFSHAYRYFTAAGGRIKVLISEDLQVSADSATMVANVQKATWSDVTSNFTLAEPADGASNPLAEAGSMTLDAYKGKKIAVAFKYEGDGNGKTTTAQIDDVIIKTEGDENAEQEMPETKLMAELYSFDGSLWAPYTGVLVMQKEDFTSMGLSFDSFSASASADHFLPTWLAANYPYAREGFVRTIAYKFYAKDNTTVRADRYTFTNGEWVKDNALETRTDQFVKTNGVWVYNPSVVLNLYPVKNEPVAKQHYQAVVDWVWENVDKVNGITEKGKGYVSSYGNNEYYTGSSAYYNNVDMRPAKAREQYPTEYEAMSDEEITKLMTERLITCWARGLEAIHTDVEPVEGIDVTYTVNLAIYTGTQVSKPTHTIVYKVVEKGKFEYVEGSFTQL